MAVKARERKRMYRYLTFGLLTLLVSISMAVTACERPSQDADAAYQHGDYAKAYRLYKPMAEKGDARAQHILSVMYFEGQGVPQDYAEATKWIRRAAEQGNAVAQYKLGVLYDQGKGVPQDYAEAMKWIRKAAEQGLSDAQHNLGFMYEKGQGVPQNYTEAEKWYRKAMKWYRIAAEQGEARSQYFLGVMYFEGQGVPQDYIVAHMWFNLAASRVSATEGEEKKMAVKYRDRVASKMTAPQIAEAQRLAREWRTKKEGK